MGVCVGALDRPGYGLLTKRVVEKVRLRALREYGNFALAYSATFQPGLDYFGERGRIPRLQASRQHRLRPFQSPRADR